MNITLKELLAYTTEEQGRWERWFSEHGDEPLRIALAGDRMTTIGAMIQHFLGTEIWFAERLAGVPATEWWTEPCDHAAALMELGRRGKQVMGAVIEQTPDGDWATVVEFSGGGKSLRVSKRKAVLNALIHEIRHWAQVATLVRQHGIAPPGGHDIILSGALE